MAHEADPVARPVVPMVIRGAVVEEPLIEFQGRGDSITFLAPDPHALVDRLALASPGAMQDLYRLSFAEILDYLEELGERLDVERNEHMRWARELTYLTSPHTRPLIDNGFAALPALFTRENVHQIADRTIGVAHLDGWVDTRLDDGSIASVRAYGARTLHIIPGNGAAAAAATIIRNAFTRGDCIVKTPSNNPFCAVAIARTMCEMAPEHPITRHTSVAYWRGGDEQVERRLCQPHNIEKIVAWGGLASVKHVAQFVQPGLELITLDPKYSAGVVGADALIDEDAARETALRIAIDVGAQNQTACCSARVVYVVTDGLDDAEERVTRLGHDVYQTMMDLPEGMSSKPKAYDPELRSHVNAVALQDDWYTVIGGDDGEGCVIVSHTAEPVDFAALLADRTVNLVPVASLDDMIGRIDAYTQTIGVHPEHLKDQLRERAALSGAQRLVSMGYASYFPGCTPHDGIELERRMCKWIVDIKSEPVALSLDAPDARTRPAVTPNTLRAFADAS